jgi:hypothetical protein
MESRMERTCLVDVEEEAELLGKSNQSSLSPTEDFPDVTSTTLTTMLNYNCL